MGSGATSTPAWLEPLVRRIYPALAQGDADALRELLDPDFAAHFADGLPFGIGGDHVGADAVIRDAWWEIGRAYRMRAEPEEWLATEDGRLLVRGFYRGTGRSSGTAIEAEFTHLWAGQDGRLTSLRQLTDTARWMQALAPNFA
jgi:2-(1,2-epoxy-1,2-dihydrophenyl)acetyl-CoA isomerase